MHDPSSEHVPIPLPWRLSRELRLPRPPWWMIAILVGATLLATAPIVWLLATRGRPFSSPRVDWIQDMGSQPRFGPQSASGMFVDHRAMRMPVAGTIAQGSLKNDPHYFFGYENPIRPETQKPELRFFDDLPESVRVQELVSLLARGRQRFQIYCVPCHGDTGAGDGLVSRRAVELAEPKWVAPTHLMMQSIRDKPDGYLFSVISRGVRNMPSYAIQIPPEDRWAIVAYLRQLQREQPVAPEPPLTPGAAPTNRLPATSIPAVSIQQ